jgi:hypothetical protein
MRARGCGGRQVKGGVGATERPRARIEAPRESCAGLAAGAEFVVMICGDVMKMTGLPAIPGAYGIGVDAKVNIFGMF